MYKLTLDILNDGRATVLGVDDQIEPKQVATIYRMKDGWHTKLANDHTRHAWSGPFESPELAFEAFQSSVSASA